MNNIKRAIEVLLTTCSECKNDENILIVTDDSSFEIADIMWQMMEDYPNKTLIKMTDREMHGEEPNDLVAISMLKSDVIFGCTSVSLYHSNARKNAVKNNARFINMADYSMPMLENGGLHGDFIAYREDCSHLDKKLKNRDKLHLTSPNGTDFRCSIKGIAPTPQYGRSVKNGETSSPPDVECATCAIEGTGDGKVIIDASIPHPRLGLLENPIELYFEKGILKDIIGKEEADILSEILKEFNDEKIYIVGEIGLGLNDSCKLSGNMLEDEGCAETCHIALGDSLGFGGNTESDYHLDLIFHKPSVEVDGEMIMEEGKIIRD